MRDDTLIMVIEDESIDALRVMRAFKDLKINRPLKVVRSAEEALEYLKHDTKALPGLIITDLALPGMTGMAFLATLREQEDWRRIPVVVMTSSRSDWHKTDCFDMGAAGFFVKPASYPDLVEAVRTIEAYWTLSELP